jgi:hypothetical protein
MKFFAVILVAGIFAIPTSHAEVAVGNCRPHLVSYSTISEAVAAVPANATVLVCPGTYPEQVTITQPMTLRGLSDVTRARAVIAVPSGGLVTNAGQADQLLVQGKTLGDFGPVNIINLVVDGTGSGFDCTSGGEFAGIEYLFASGSLENSEVRNQNPGGCGFGLFLVGSPGATDTVNVRTSDIHDFDNTGVLVTSNGSSSFLVNLDSNQIESTSATVQAGVEYELADGVVARNTVDVGGQFGLLLGNFFRGMTATGNTIIGSNVGIRSGCCSATINRNILFNNGTGISVFSSADVKSNTIVQSRITAIDVGCSEEATAENNIIVNSPIGIAEVNTGDIFKGNVLYGVTTPTTPCTD